jgi:Na+-driven multidrug efflux pump
VLLTGLVGPFGSGAIAGYGMGTRLEYLQIPLVFGFGSALVAMVGTNIGAGRRQRAERVAWIGAGLAAALTGTIGLAGALFPERWMALFTSEASVQMVGSRYLRTVGPAYGFFGAGLALYPSQGAGRPPGPPWGWVGSDRGGRRLDRAPLARRARRALRGHRGAQCFGSVWPSSSDSAWR